MLYMSCALAALVPSLPALQTPAHAPVVTSKLSARMSLSGDGVDAAPMLRRASAAPMLQPHMDRRSALAGALCLAPTIMWPSSASAAMGAELKYFPGSMTSADLDQLIGDALDERGYHKGNTLFAHSVCSDEVNFNRKEIIDLQRRRWGESFTMGGLAGLPFAGKAGLGAFAHHVPDEGKLLIMFAPHVGLGFDGKVGALERDGIADVSSACGAAVGAFKTLSKPGATVPSSLNDLNDIEFDYIKMKLAPRLAGVSNSQNSLAYVTYQMYAMVKESILEQIAAVPGIWDDCAELAVIGGVQINRYGQKDMFQPLMFQTITKAGKKVDLYPSTFGKMPALGSIIGSDEIASSIVSGGLTVA